jgi:XapX domain-containing protein
MRALLISFVVGLGVGLIYGLIRVKSPAPPIVALLGLLGMVLGEQAADWLHAKRAANDGPGTVLVSHAPGLASRTADLPSKND